MSAWSSGYPIHSNSSRALKSGSAVLSIPRAKSEKKSGIKACKYNTHET